MTDSSDKMSPQERITQDRVDQSRKFLRSNGFNQSLRDLWSEVKENSKDSKYDYYKFLNYSKR